MRCFEIDKTLFYLDLDHQMLTGFIVCKATTYILYNKLTIVWYDLDLESLTPTITWGDMKVVHDDLQSIDWFLFTMLQKKNTLNNKWYD